MNLRIATTLFAAVLAVACTSKTSSDGQSPSASAPDTNDAASAASDGKSLTIKGSDTMVLLSQRIAERFMAENPGTSVQVTGGGSGTGIASLINGTTDIATASRAMKDSEKKLVEQRRGSPAVETPVALDGIAIYVHESNTIPRITPAQLRAIYTGETKNWSELGGPDAPILLYSRENNSGTYAYFKEEVLDDEDFAAETLSLPGTAAVVNAVSRDRNAIGYGGIAYSSGIRVVPVAKDEASKAVIPTLENVTTGAYPISRQLFVYTAGKPQGVAKDFIDYTLSDAGQAIAADVGYFPLPKQDDSAR